MELEEEWITISDSSTIVYLSDVNDNYDVTLTLKNPSTPSQEYDEASYVLINDSGDSREYFIYLKEKDEPQVYIEPIKEIHLLTVNDVSLAI